MRNSDGEPDYFISVIEDISERQAALRERKNLELSLQKTLKRLSNLHLIDKAILKAENPQAIAQTAIGEIPKFIHCQRISVVTFDWERETATVLATQGQGTQSAGNGFQVSLEVWQDLIGQLEKSDLNQNYFVAYLSKFPQLSQAVPALQRGFFTTFIVIAERDKDVICRFDFAS